MKQFLIVYRRSAGEILSMEDLGTVDPATAMRKRFALEMREREDPDVEVVLLAAASREALMRTHSRYFKSSGQLAADLVKAVG
jgi:hypothetical protein